MKKIIGILLAVCFVLSVTAAAASAHEEGKFVWKKVKHVEWHHGKKVVWFTWEKVWVEEEHHNHWKPAKPAHHWKPVPQHHKPAPAPHHGGQNGGHHSR